MRTVTIDLGARSYPLRIGRGSDRLFDMLARLAGDDCLLVTSPRVRRHCLKAVQKNASFLARREVIEIPDGEAMKSPATLIGLYWQLVKRRAGRKTCLALLGGGVLGDLAGFAAATYLRGIPYLQIPTTLVAQIDSAIGGKVGINLPEGKNLVGSFYHPRAVFADVTLLQTLPVRQFRSGLAEALKCGLLQGPSLYHLLAGGRQIAPGDQDRLEEVIARSAHLKAAIVSQDEREETGLRRVLNLGHTFGHALERITRYRRYLHGEAVAIGIVLAAKASARRGSCDPELARQIEQDLRNLGLPTAPPSFSKARWRSAIEVDKKREAGMIQFVFLKKIGEVSVEPIAVGELLKLL